MQEGNQVLRIWTGTTEQITDLSCIGLLDMEATKQAGQFSHRITQTSSKLSQPCGWMETIFTWSLKIKFRTGQTCYWSTTGPLQVSHPRFTKCCWGRPLKSRIASFCCFHLTQRTGSSRDQATLQGILPFKLTRIVQTICTTQVLGIDMCMTTRERSQGNQSELQQAIRRFMLWSGILQMNRCTHHSPLDITAPTIELLQESWLLGTSSRIMRRRQLTGLTNTKATSSTHPKFWRGNQDSGLLALARGSAINQHR